MTHGSLFSGIGGFDLAAEWMGWQNVFHCEWNPFGQKVLKHYWPNAISYADITKTDFTIHRGNIDILTGGFPCQPYSLAGKRKGKEDERHLWPEMLRAIREIQPSWVVGENVFGLVNWNGGLVFDEVQTELEAQGYEVQSYVLPACSVNAPHRRDRIWFVAFNAKFAANGRYNTGESPGTRLDLERFQLDQTRRQQGTNDIRTSGIDVPHSGSFGCDNGSDNREKRHIQTNIGITEENKPKRYGRKRRFRAVSSNDTNSNNERSQRSENNGGIGKSRENRNEFFAGLLPSNWQNFPTQSPICNGDDGISSRLDGITFPKWRNESIKAGGNAIVPQVAHQIFKAIEAMRQG